MKNRFYLWGNYFSISIFTLLILASCVSVSFSVIYAQNQIIGITLGTIFAIMLLPCIYYSLKYVFVKCTIDNEKLSMIGVFKKKTIYLAEISDVQSEIFTRPRIQYKLVVITYLEDQKLRFPLTAKTRNALEYFWDVKLIWP